MLKLEIFNSIVGAIINENMHGKKEKRYLEVSRGRGIKCKKCGSKFRVIFGFNPEKVSKIFGRECGYKLYRGNKPLDNLSNIVCSKCGNKKFEVLSIDEKLELQREWLKKFSSWKHPAEIVIKSPIYLSRSLREQISQVSNIFEVPKVQVSSNCTLCFKENDISKTKYGLPICTEHYVTDIRKFLIKKFYLKIKEKNSRTIKENPKVATWIFNDMLNKIFWSLTWEPETISEFQYLMFCEYSNFTGYLMLRLSETLPDLGERLYAISSEKIKRPRSKEFEIIYNKLFLDMSAEYEFFVGTKFAVSGYFDIAIDNEDNPKKIVIIPVSNEDAINRIFSLRLKDANAGWYGTFRKVLHSPGIITVANVSAGGTFFQLDWKIILKNFELFKAIWNQTFHCNTAITPEDFQNFWDWLKWVVAPNGFTETNQNNATYFGDYKKFGLKKNLVFETLNQILPDLRTKQHLISTNNLSQKDPALLLLGELAHIAHGFRVLCPKERIYFVPCREWFYNAIMPVIVKFAINLKLSGPSFEKNIARIFSFYSKAGIRKGELSLLGPMVEPLPHGLMIEPDVKADYKLRWKILEKNLSIEIPKDSSPKGIGGGGELDLLIYVNNDLYLIELKALNLESKIAIEYLEEKTPIQCAKYAYWVRKSNQFKEILQKHGIKEQDIRSIRILACCSGVSEKLIAKCQETGEHFAIVPEFVLFSVMADLFYQELDECFPSRIEGMAAGFRVVAEKNPPTIIQLDLRKEIVEKISNKFSEWKKLITFDRRLVG